MSGISAIHEFLRDARVPYSVLPHRPAFTAEEEAAATHVPGRDWAKVVVCFVDGEPIEAVIPAPTVVDLDRLLELTGGSRIRLAQEDERQEGRVHAHITFSDTEKAMGGHLEEGTRVLTFSLITLAETDGLDLTGWDALRTL